MENCKLSRDMMVEILSRLPVKSLMRFKCVCKFFYDLIKSDQHFMHKHYEISKAKTDCVLLEVGYDCKEYYLLYKESEYNEIGCIYLDIPGTPRARWVKCCKGMICLISTKNDKLDNGDYLIYDIFIWNPSIRKVKDLPSVTVPYRAPCDVFALSEFGFGISNNMTWKVVMLIEICSSFDGRTVHQITMVYSQDHGDSWSLREINSVTNFRNIQNKSNDFYLKGRYYWQTRGHGKHCLIWFDMNNEVFGTIELPAPYYTFALVSIMNETIVLFDSPIVGNTRCNDIWLMIENDNNTYWCKQARIDSSPSIYNNIEFLRPIGIWNVDGELLVFLDRTVDPNSEHADVPYFISLDLVTQERKMFSISKERKSITIASNPTPGNIQVYNERNTDTIEEWKYHMSMQRINARVYYESLYLP
ncbi:PREDICTED: F-box/kelch-repeat protein At3g23880-like [Ipomoea nil]|uniref:F-box/kelch-repeat protein At3g23880-like n=1 Tax=Ipomoea nil TaxID=35883 RepID=UPI0009012426|nr:PREDICTED: F-box/kelch-repeat protein At3g23880-like [Ipomoea nil]